MGRNRQRWRAPTYLVVGSSGQVIAWKAASLLAERAIDAIRCRLFVRRTRSKSVPPNKASALRCFHPCAKLNCLRQRGLSFDSRATGMREVDGQGATGATMERQEG